MHRTEIEPFYGGFEKNLWAERFLNSIMALYVCYFPSQLLDNYKLSCVTSEIANFAHPDISCSAGGFEKDLWVEKFQVPMIVLCACFSPCQFLDNYKLSYVPSVIANLTKQYIPLSREVFVFRSPVKKIIESPLANLLKKWNLLPH
jgi:hypothetical protein